jgi:hypothetical protein
LPHAPAPTTSLVPTPQQIHDAVEHHGHLLKWRADGRQFRIQFLTQMAQLADDQGLIPFSQKELLARLGLSRGTLENTLAILVKARALIARGHGRNARGYQFLPDWFQVPDTPAPPSAQPDKPVQLGQPRPKQKTRPGELPPWQVAINHLRNEFQTALQQLRSDLALSPTLTPSELPTVQTITPAAAPPPEPEITVLRSELKDGFLSLSSLLEKLLPAQPVADRLDIDALPATPVEVPSSTERKETVQPDPTTPTPDLKPTPLPLATPPRPGRPLSSNPNKIEARADALFKHLLPLADQFQDLTQLDLDSVIQDLAGQELDWQQQHYPQDDGSPNWNTILKTNLRIFKKRLKLQVASLLASHIDSPIGQLADLWCNAFDTLVRPHTWELNSDYRENAHDQALSPTPVDLSPLLQQAFHTLQKVADGSLTVPWQAVSSAMALATGRRQAEIHSTATFKPSSDYEVLFCPRGDRPFAQTKTRPGSEAHKEWLENPIRPIPTLLPASLILAGDKFLEKGYKVNHENQVNANFNAKLRSHMHSFAPGFQYKNLRDFYAVACLRNWLNQGLPEGSLHQRIKLALGHGPLGDATPSYMKFSLAPDSLSKI